MRKSNYKQLIILILTLYSAQECYAQNQERDPERFLRECDCNRMFKELPYIAEEKFGCGPGTDPLAQFCWTVVTDMDCVKIITIYNLEKLENFYSLMNYPDDGRRMEFISDMGFDSISGTCSRSDVTEDQKEYCYENENWITCCTGGLSFFCDGEKSQNVGTDPVHIFLHGLCGVLWVLFIGYAVLSGW